MKTITANELQSFRPYHSTEKTCIGKMICIYLHYIR